VTRLYRLDDQGTGVHFLVEAEIFLFLHSIKTGSGARLVGTGGSFPGSKAPDVKLISTTDVKNAWNYIHSPICLHGMVLN
jgi:hypothetical protein